MKVITNSALRILIVEEDEYFILHLTTLIKNIGYSVIQVIRNQAKTLSAISECLPDLVVMGLDSPEKQILFKYAKTLKNRTPPILFITNFSKTSLYSNPRIGTQTTEDNIRKAIKQKITTLDTPYRVGNNVFKYKGLLFFAKKGIYYTVKITDILYLKAVDDYAIIYTPEEIVTIFMGIKELKELLIKELFVQIHRSYLLNAQKKITSDLNSTNFYIDGKYIVPISRRLKKKVLAWFKSKNISIPSQF